MPMVVANTHHYNTYNSLSLERERTRVFLPVKTLRIGELRCWAVSDDGDPLIPPTGSVRDIYVQSSYGKLIIDSTVLQYRQHGNPTRVSCWSPTCTLWLTFYGSLSKCWKFWRCCYWLCKYFLPLLELMLTLMFCIALLHIEWCISSSLHWLVQILQKNVADMMMLLLLIQYH